ncbi:MAG: hypothetical protein K2K70_09310 [Lachnospiraceae bacterium]|nr:hypothetical protein [Lachnospiraceae bacterium]
MAVHFSEEEQKKLEQDEAEIYKKRTKESEAEERKNFTFKQKIQNFKYYYLQTSLIALVIIAMIGWQIYDYVTKDKVALFILLQNDVLTDETVDSLEKELAEYLHFRKGEAVRISEASDNYQIQTFLYSGTADIIIASEKDFSEWAVSDYLSNQNVHEAVSFYADYPEELRYYTQIISGEDVRNNTTNTDVKPSDPTRYNCGLYLTDSEKYEQIGGMIQKPVIGLNYAGKHQEDAARVVQYLMDNSQKMETKKTVK